MTAATARAEATTGAPDYRGSTARDRLGAGAPAADHTGHGCCADRDGAGARTLIGFSESDGYRAIALPLMCRSWRCHCCAAQLRRKYRARALRGSLQAMGSGERFVMVTLTIDLNDPRLAASIARVGRGLGSSWADTKGSIKHAAASWNRLRGTLVRGRRRRGAPFLPFGRIRYYRGLELTGRGIAHLHVLIRVNSLAEYWRLRTVLAAGEAERAGFGRIEQVDLARSRADVARYVTKAVNPTADDAEGRELGAYVTKGAIAPMPRYTRRFSWSVRDAEWAPWTPATPIAGYSWRVGQLSVDRAVEALIASDFVIVDAGRSRVRSSVPLGAGKEGAA